MPRKLVHVTLRSPHHQDLAKDWERLGFALEAAGGLVLDDGVRLDFISGVGGVMVGLNAEPGETPPEPQGEAARSFTLLAPSAAAAPNHLNGACGLRAVIAVSESPADHAEYLSALTGQREMLATSAGLEIRLEGARLEVLTAPAFAFRLGVAPDGPDEFRISGLIFAVKSLADTESLLRAKGIKPTPHAGVTQAGRLLAGVVEGVAVAFEQA